MKTLIILEAGLMVVGCGNDKTNSLDEKNKKLEAELKHAKDDIAELKIKKYSQNQSSPLKRLN